MACALLYFVCISITLFMFNQAATTNASPLCAKCLPRSVILTPSDGTAGSITPKIKWDSSISLWFLLQIINQFRMLPYTNRGCRQMNIICTTPTGYTKSNMVFNGAEPSKVGKDVKALISCFKGSWHTTFMGSYIYVDTVKCYAT